MATKTQKPKYEYPLVVVAVDPGGTTGVVEVLFEADSFHLLVAHQFTDPNKAHLEVQHIISAHDLPVHLVVEQWDKRPGITDPDFSAKYVERDIDNNVGGYAVKHKQIPAEAKNMVKEPARNSGRGDGLKRFGLYSTGKMKHANDAARHAITYAVMQLKHLPITLVGWPKPKDKQ